MSDSVQPVRRRINNWYIDDMLGVLEKTGYFTPSFEDCTKSVLAVYSIDPSWRDSGTDKTSQEKNVPNVPRYTAKASALVYPAAVVSRAADEHPTCADVYYGQRSLERFLAMKLAANIVTRKEREGVLKELLNLYRRNEVLHGIFKPFLAPSAVGALNVSLLNAEQRVNFKIAFNLILFGLMGEVLSAVDNGEYLALARKILDKLDKGFRNDWQVAKQLYKEFTLWDWEYEGDEDSRPESLVIERVDRIRELRVSWGGDGHYDVSELACIRFFMMTRKTTTDVLAGEENRKFIYMDLIHTVFSAAVYEYMPHKNRMPLALPTSAKGKKKTLENMGVVNEMLTFAHEAMRVPTSSIADGYFAPNKDKPVSPHVAAASVLSSYGISMCGLYSMSTCGNILEDASVTLDGMEVSAAAALIGAGDKPTPAGVVELLTYASLDDAYYLSVISMLAKAYMGETSPDKAAGSTNKDASQLTEALLLQKNNERLEEENKRLTQELADAKAAADDVEALVQARTAAAIEEYKRTREAQMAIKLQKKDERIARLEDRVDEVMQAVRDTLERDGAVDQDAAAKADSVLAENDVTLQDLTEEDFDAIEEALKGLKVYIFGGREDWRKKVKATFPYIPTIPVDTYVKYLGALSNADIIILNTFCCSHKSYDGVVNAAKKGNAQLIFVGKEKGPNAVAHQLINALKVRTPKA